MKLIICLLIGAILAPFCYAIEVERNVDVDFIVKAPSRVYANKPFRATIKVVDANGRVVKDYNVWGDDLKVMIGASGQIQPAYISISAFKGGVAKIDFTCSKEGKVEFSFERVPKEKQDPNRLYTIAPFDVVEVAVWQAEGLTKEIVVSPDGDIFFL